MGLNWAKMGCVMAEKRQVVFAGINDPVLQIFVGSLARPPQHAPVGTGQWLPLGQVSLCV
jgi:hypothetical protein